MSDELIRPLYRSLIEAWNTRDADAFARVFDADGEVVGFDGTEVRGPDAIAAHLAGIFGAHATPRYVTVVRGVQAVTTEVVILRAVAGLVPEGQQAPDPKLHAIQRLVAVQRAGHWRCVLFQNTPAQLHGRPIDLERLTAELTAAMA